MKKIKFTAVVLLIVTLLTSCNVTITIPGLVKNPSTQTPSNPSGSTPSDGEETPNDPSEDDNPGDTSKPSDYNNDEITFDKGEQVFIIVRTGAESNYAYNAQELVTEITGMPSFALTDDNPESSNEFVVGRCNRESSRAAYALLEQAPRENLFNVRFSIYSAGNSVAIAYDDDAIGYEQYIVNTATAFFESRYVTRGEPLNLAAGESYVGSIDLMEYQNNADAMLRSELWSDFERIAGAEAAAVLREKYDELYSADGLVNWFANLFDTEIGGFYYSNAARDNYDVAFNYSRYQLLPDIESTAQALGFINSSGMILNMGSIKDALPEWMRLAIIKFIKERQDPGGYFYHPQWTHAMVDKELSRRGRDLTNAVSVLEQLGAKPTYETPSGAKGDGLLWDGTPVPVSALTLPIDIPRAAAVSFVTATASAVPSHLKDKASFEAYLAGLNIKGNSYWVGNQLASQAAQIKARDEVLLKEGADYSLTAILHEWLNKNCDAKTGNWSGSADYAGLNGLMKISSVYSTLKIPLPYPEASVKSAIAAIDTEEINQTVCYTYNCWVTICNIINDVQTNVSDTNERNRIIGDIRAELRLRAPELIRATLDKQGIFLCEDGSFSYTVEYSAAQSQGMPVTIPGTKEGDVNATVICTEGTLDHMFSALGYPSVPIMYRGDFNRMLMIIEANRAKADME